MTRKMAFDSDTFAFVGWPFASVGCVTLLLVVVALLAWSTLAGRDLWPFSHYPMFAANDNATGVRGFRLRFHFADGRTTQLGDHAGDLAEAFAEKLERRAPVATPPTEAELAWVRDFWIQACRQHPPLAAAVRLEVIMGAALIPQAGEITVVERVVLGCDIAAPTSGTGAGAS
ncbi:MAG: hypothetical protein RLZZ15_2179 [Verrucomicrobiota bacterium]|jgi:hypothetical protein